MTEAYPLKWPDGWARTPYHHRTSYSRFNTMFDKSRQKLLSELRLLGADPNQVVISSWLQLRKDGMPLASAARQRMEDPGVAVYFTLKKRPMVMARDAYTSVHDNLTAIVHAISHLRGLERHGGGGMMERAFSGFAALPAPGTSAGRHWTDVLGYPHNWRELTPETQRNWCEAAYKRAAKITHPDVEGGNEQDFHEVQRAREQALANVGQSLPAGL